MIRIHKRVWSKAATVKCLTTTPRNSPGHLIRTWTTQFMKAAVTEPELSAKFIVLHVLKNGKRPNKNLHRKVLTREEITEVEALGEKRLRKQPIQYILGEWDFRTVYLKLRPPVLIPRPETEDLVDHIFNHLETSTCSTLNFLEIGCGSGAISVSLLKESRTFINGLAVDILPEAVKLAKENAVINHVDSRLTVTLMDIKDCVSQIEKKFDLVVSNPPYIKTEALNDLQPEILWYESHVALDGGKDGLHVIGQILKNAHTLLKPNGYLWLESGLDQDLRALVSLNAHWGLEYVNHLPDSTERLRFHQLKLRI